MINKIFGNKYFKIIFVLVASFVFARFSGDNIFLANTPRFNPGFIVRVSTFPGRILAKIRSGINPINIFLGKPNYSDVEVFTNVKEATPPSEIVFQIISKGVSAAEDPNTGEKYIKVAGGTKYKIDGFVTVNGKNIPKIEFIE